VIEPMSDILERMEAFDPTRFGSSTYDAGGLRSETFDAEPLDAETFEPQTFEPEPLDAEAFEPEAFEQMAFEPEAFEQKAFEPEAFEPETMLEPEPFGTEPFDAATIAAADRTADDAGLVSRVSAATFQVSQAMEGLEQVAGLLRAAEELAKDSDGQRRGAEEALGLVESQRKELGEMLTRVRSEAAEAGQRVAAAEERANTAEERANTAEERLQQALERTFALEARLDDGTGEEPVAETARQLTVIVDDRREELREAVATEIRRPLTSIMGLTLAMKHADPTSSSGKTMIRQLGASARRLERLVVQLIGLDGIANGSYVPNRRRVDLKAIVRRVVEETPDIAELDVRVHAEHAAVETDPALTEQMVEILLANAGRRSSPGNPVWVQVASDQTGAVIAVDDTCAEIPAGMQVEGLEDGDGARQKRPKGATGLALLSRLAELHGGRAWVEARPGGGASFRVFLPSTSPEPNAGTPDAKGTTDELENHQKVVVDATAVRSPSMTEQLRDLSSFDDLSDEVAI
jgi:signal transduction histidine kinase